MVIPGYFKERMKLLLGTGYQEYEESLDRPPVKALRLQKERCPGLKPESLNFHYTEDVIPWERLAGCFIQPEEEDVSSLNDTPGKHPLHDAGIYYIQDPSAMAPVYYLDPLPGERVLDLCAAPGGKSTQIADRMEGRGILISNEFDPARSQILSSNIERMGITNCVVTNAAPSALAERFEGYFDKILVDAPCSGEGMMRKNPEAVRQWSPELIRTCSERQRDILRGAVRMLAPGGRLVYSTCTFAPEEDEEIIEYILEKYPTLSPGSCDIPPSSGGIHGLSGNSAVDGACIRLFPHLSLGDGHFLAVIKNDEGADEADNAPFRMTGNRIPADNTAKRVTYMDAFSDFLSAYVPDQETGSLFAGYGYTPEAVITGEKLTWLPEDLSYRRRSAGLHILREGLRLGSIDTDRSGKTRFVPDHALSHVLTAENFVVSFPSRSDFIRAYIRGEAIRPGELTGIEDGWCRVCADGYGIGWCKKSGNILKNHYPKGLRR